jgi:hypothetical protein
MTGRRSSVFSSAPSASRLCSPTTGSLQPTGKSVGLRVDTFARWKDGLIVEESLFWDGASISRQLSLA